MSEPKDDKIIGDAVVTNSADSSEDDEQHVGNMSRSHLEYDLHPLPDIKNLM